jgi:hypothetical protein
MNFIDGYASTITVSQNTKAKELFKLLNIPHSNTVVHNVDLYEILMDEERLNKIVSIMKNKAFW